MRAVTMTAAVFLGFIVLGLGFLGVHPERFQMLVETFLINGKSLLADDLPCQIDRETVGIIQPENIRTVDDRLSRGFYFFLVGIDELDIRQIS